MKQRIFGMIIHLSILLVLSACGGNGGPGAPPQTAPLLEPVSTYGDVYYDLDGVEKGVILCFHGTGGSAAGWTSGDKLSFLTNLQQGGYAFVCPTSLNLTTKQWSTTNSVNADVVNVDAILTHLNVPSDTPLYLVGHSNGGQFTSRYGIHSSRETAVKAVQISNAVGVTAILNAAAYELPTLFTYADCDLTVDAAGVRNSILILNGKTPPVPAVDNDIDDIYTQGSYGSCHEFVDVSSTTTGFFDTY